MSDLVAHAVSCHLCSPRPIPPHPYLFIFFHISGLILLPCRSGPLYLQDWAKKWSPSLVNIVPAVAYHFCLNLPAAFTQPGTHFLAHLSNVRRSQCRLTFRRNSSALRPTPSLSLSFVVFSLSFCVTSSSFYTDGLKSGSQVARIFLAS